MKGLKIRVPDVPAYRATPEACGANPTPIAFAEVYLALQNGTVDAQENPLTTIEAKKFYEVQKHIMLTGHIVDGLTTQVAPHVWTKLSDAEKKIFSDVALEAAARASAQIKKREAELVDEFKKKGLQIVQVNRQSFVDAVLKAKSVESMGFDKKDYDRIVADQVTPEAACGRLPQGAPPAARQSRFRGGCLLARVRWPQPLRLSTLIKRDLDGHRCRPEGDGRRRRVPRHRRGRGSVAHAVRGLGRAGAVLGPRRHRLLRSSSPATRSTTRPRGPRRSRATC